MRPAKFQCSATYFAGKPLVSYERRIAGRALEPLVRSRSPCKKITLMNRRSRNSLMEGICGLQIMLDTNGIRVSDKKLPVSARWIKKAVVVSSNSPSNEGGSHLARGVV